MNPKIEEWAREQFESVNLGDERLNKRAQIIACNMIKNPESSINMQSEKWAESKAAYRFFDSDKVHFQNLIKPHTDIVKAEANTKEIILAIQDTCSIGYGHHPSVKGLGHIGSESSKGIILHNNLAIDPSGKSPLVIGVLY